MRIFDRRNQLVAGEETVVTEVGADAAANAEAGTITVPAGERWLLKAVHVECVQGATQTPWPRLVIGNGSRTVFVGHSGTAAQAASTTCQHSWAPGQPVLGPSGATTACAAQGPLPEGLILEAGWTIATSTVGLGANTNYGVMAALVQKLSAAV